MLRVERLKMADCGVGFRRVKLAVRAHERRRAIRSRASSASASAEFPGRDWLKVRRYGNANLSRHWAVSERPGANTMLIECASAYAMMIKSTRDHIPHRVADAAPPQKLLSANRRGPKRRTVATNETNRHLPSFLREEQLA